MRVPEFLATKDDYRNLHLSASEGYQLRDTFWPIVIV